MEKELSEQENNLLYLLNDMNDLLMNDIIKIIKSWEEPGVLIDGITETEKHEIKKQEGGFLGALLAPLVASLVRPVIFSAVKCIRGRRVRRAGRGYMDKNF